LEAVTVTEKSLVERVEAAGSRGAGSDASGYWKDLEAVQAAGISTVSELITALNDATQDSEVRLSACTLLAWLNERDATAALEQAFVEAQDDGLIWEAAKALEHLRAKRAAPALIRMLKHGNSTKQAAAAWLLGLLGLRETIRPVWTAAMDPALNVLVRGHAIEALGLLQAKEAVQDLTSLLADRSPDLRYWAAYALGQIGDPSSVPALQRMANVDDAVLPGGFSLRQEALDALDNIRERKL
jgi:HEAT repeat protein